MKIHALKRIVIALVVIGIIAVIAQLFGVEFNDKWGQLLMPLFAYTIYELLDGRFINSREDHYDIGYALVALWASAYFFKGVFADNGVDSTVALMVIMAEYLTALIVTPRIVTLPSHGAIQNEKLLRALKAKREYIMYSRQVRLDLAYYSLAKGDKERAEVQTEIAEVYSNELEQLEFSIKSAKFEKKKGDWHDINKAIEDLDERLR